MISKKLAFVFGVILLCSFVKVDKKTELLKVTEKYMTESHELLQLVKPDFVEIYTTGKKFDDYVLSLPTVIHEAFHAYRFNNNDDLFSNERGYRMNDTLTLFVDKFETFPSIEIKKIAPKKVREQIFRYPNYISTKNKIMDTQQNGIHGLLEEYSAYMYSLKISVQLFDYYKEREEKTTVKEWANYLGEIGSYRYALDEFELFISWYLQTAKKYHSKTYQKIIKNESLKKLYSFVHQEKSRLKSEYDTNRNWLLDKYEEQLVIREGYIFVVGSDTGFGLSDDKLEMVENLLIQPEHTILENLLEKK